MALLPDLAHQECVEVLIHQRVCHMGGISLQKNLVPVPSSLTITTPSFDLMHTLTWHLINFTLLCSNIAEIRPCDEGTSVKAVLCWNLVPAARHSWLNKARADIIMLNSDDHICTWKFILGRNWWCCPSVHVLVHDAGDRPESRKQWRYHGEKLYLKFNETHLYLKTLISSKQG